MEVNKTSKGFGDTVEKIINITGIKKIVDTFSSKPKEEKCTPCEQRKKALNQAFPYQQKTK
jgi:hypothetical protein